MARWVPASRAYSPQHLKPAPGPSGPPKVLRSCLTHPVSLTHHHLLWANQLTHHHPAGWVTWTAPAGDRGWAGVGDARQGRGPDILRARLPARQGHHPQGRQGARAHAGWVLPVPRPLNRAQRAGARPLLLVLFHLISILLAGSPAKPLASVNVPTVRCVRSTAIPLC